jgi:hypothetical protein
MAGLYTTTLCKSQFYPLVRDYELGLNFSVVLNSLPLGQRLYNYIDNKPFVGVLLKQDSRWVHQRTLCLSVDPSLTAVFLGC